MRDQGPANVCLHKRTVMTDVLFTIYTWSIATVGMSCMSILRSALAIDGSTPTRSKLRALRSIQPFVGLAGVGQCIPSTRNRDSNSDCDQLLSTPSAMYVMADVRVLV